MSSLIIFKIMYNFIGCFRRNTSSSAIVCNGFMEHVYQKKQRANNSVEWWHRSCQAHEQFTSNIIHILYMNYIFPYLMHIYDHLWTFIATVDLSTILSNCGKKKEARENFYILLPSWKPITQPFHSIINLLKTVQTF